MKIYKITYNNITGGAVNPQTVYTINVSGANQPKWLKYFNNEDPIKIKITQDEIGITRAQLEQSGNDLTQQYTAFFNLIKDKIINKAKQNFKYIGDPKDIFNFDKKLWYIYQRNPLFLSNITPAMDNITRDIFGGSTPNLFYVPTLNKDIIELKIHLKSPLFQKFDIIFFTKKESSLNNILQVLDEYNKFGFGGYTLDQLSNQTFKYTHKDKTIELPNVYLLEDSGFKFDNIINKDTKEIIKAETGDVISVYANIPKVKTGKSNEY